MTKEDTKDNSFGIASVIFGILSIVFSSPPINGIVLGILGFIFAKKQHAKHPNVWSRRGKILSVIGILLSIVFLVFLVWLTNNPEYLPQLGQLGTQ
jgi:ABC-type methionine transport system permease subunit